MLETDDVAKVDVNSDLDIHVELGTGVFDENGNPVNSWIEPKERVLLHGTWSLNPWLGIDKRTDTLHWCPSGDNSLQGWNKNHKKLLNSTIGPLYQSKQILLFHATEQDQFLFRISTRQKVTIR